MALTVASAAINVPRDAHYVLANDAITYRTMLLEVLRTNAWSKSQELDDAVWVKTRATITANATTAPDLTATMDKLVEDGTLGTHVIERTTSALTDNLDTTYSFFVKAAERSTFRADSYNKAGTTVSTRMNASTGGVIALGAGHTIRTEALSNGQYRVSVTFNAGVGANTPRCYVYLENGAGAVSYTGDGASGLFLWGFQLEVDQSIATSYIATTTGTASRSVDNTYFPATDAPAEQTIYTKFVELGTSVIASTPRLLQIGSAVPTATPTLLIYGIVNKYASYLDTGVGGFVESVGAVVAHRDTIETRTVLSASGTIRHHQSINGAAEVSSAESAARALPAAWADTRLYVNSGGSSNTGVNAFISVRRQRGVRTLAQMRAA